MNTTQFNDTQSKLINKMLELTMQGANGESWKALYHSFFNIRLANTGISETRRAALSRIYRSTYTANFNQNVMMCYFDGSVYYTVCTPSDPESGMFNCANGMQFRTTKDLHDRTPHLTSTQWDSMPRVQISKLNGGKF